MLFSSNGRVRAVALVFALGLAAACAASTTEPASSTPANGVAPSSSGRPVLPPKWAFGVLFGSYYDQASVLDAMERLRRDYCGDLLWVDSSWLSSSYDDAPKYITFQFDRAQFPDPKGMIDTLRRNHFHFGAWEWPYFDRSNPLYAEGASRGAFIKDASGNVVDGGGWHGVTFTGQLDFTRPDAVEWWRKLNQPLLEMGFEFFKIDTYATLPKGGVLHDGSTSDQKLRQAYHRTVYELVQSSSQGRAFILTHRQPSPENDQYPGIWTGDINSTWEGFQETMRRAAAMNTSETAAYWTADTGGYNRGNPSDELYVRWLQFGVFMPVTEFFSEKSSITRFPWKFGPAAQEAFKTYTRLRYRLLPFRYSSAQAAYHETPVRHPVRFVDGRSDEILLGGGASEILVAPIHVAGATTGEVHLPAGAAWIDYWTGTRHPGGTVPTVPAPLQVVPIFVKAGAIIPMGPEMGYVDEKPADPLTLAIYPSGNTSYTLYEDDGVSRAYMTGAFSTTGFSCDDSGGRPVITISPTKGTFTGRPSSRTYLLEVHLQPDAPATVSRDGTPLTQQTTTEELDRAAEGWIYDPAARIVRVKLRLPATSGARVTL